MKKLLKIKMTWFPIWAVPLLMLSMICIYLPVFSGADPKLSNFPLIIVNEDEQFTSSAFGKSLLSNLSKEVDGHSLQWSVVTSKEKAIDQIKDDNAYGAIVIPENFSASINELKGGFISGETDGKAAEVEILINEAGGQMATAVASNVLQTMASSASDGLSGQIKSALVSKNMQVSPLSTSVLDQPIHYTSTNVLGLPANLNKGMTPFMIVLITSITGLLGVQMINGYINKISETLNSKGHTISNTKILITELLFGLIVTLLVSAMLQLAVFGFFGSVHSIGIWPIFWFTLLSSMTMFLMFKVISLFFGKWGMLIMFPLNIMGIFGSGGAVPIANLPDFHRIASIFLPTRYMVDGMRSLLYYGGNMQASLGTALWVISSLFVVFLGICLVVTLTTHKKDSSKAKLEPSLVEA
ncbi:ABC transporter permease [Peribacillus sp. NPDC097264]|uniref:ABC transporter permease n=1 Tax=unclassified Peribacillus TaxID=2675266 RepID=UPI003811618A